MKVNSYEVHQSLLNSTRLSNLTHLAFCIYHFWLWVLKGKSIHTNCRGSIWSNSGNWVNEMREWCEIYQLWATQISVELLGILVPYSLWSFNSHKSFWNLKGRGIHTRCGKGLETNQRTRLMRCRKGVKVAKNKSFNWEISAFKHLLIPFVLWNLGNNASRNRCESCQLGSFDLWPPHQRLHPHPFPEPARAILLLFIHE